MDFILSQSVSQSPWNLKGEWSHLDHKIIFEDFMQYLIYDILQIPWLGIRKS